MEPYDPTTKMTENELFELVESYRYLTDCLLEHTVPHEGTGMAAADYRQITDDDRPSLKVLDAIDEAWRREIGQQ